MHTLRNRLLFYGGAVAAGLGTLVLCHSLLENWIDDKGLLIRGTAEETGLWIIGLAFAGLLLFLMKAVGGDGSYADNFPRSITAGALMIAAGAVLVRAIPGLDTDTGAVAATGAMQTVVDAVGAYLPWAAAVSMAVLGIYRLLGKQPAGIFGGVICLLYMVMLISNYRLWSADPQLHDYVYQLLAGVLLMLCSFHRCCCDAGVIQRKKLLATGLGAAVCCAASLSGEFQREFYLASMLFAAGSICTVRTLPPDPEEEEAPGEEEEAPEVVEEAQTGEEN